jgi:hypothetical protein|tara:strand:+ start:860 stop:1078 length:219 start_codon:yes stop_codon:yes gene_type:complete
MTYKPFDPEDRTALFLYIMDLNMPERKKSRVLKILLEEFRITHEMYKDIHDFIKGIKEEDLRGFRKQLISDN